MMSETHHLSSIMRKAPKFLRRKLKRPSKMKKDKASGPGEITSEMLTALEANLIYRKNKTFEHYPCYR